MKTAFFTSLIDDFGIWQHTDGQAPDRNEGYALDDATRGLLLCLLLKKTAQADVLFDYIAASYRGGKWYGFAHADHHFWGAPASEDAVGQVVWVMGYAQTHGYRADEAADLYAKAKKKLGSPEYLRGSAYALLGALYIDPEWAAVLAADITKRFAATTHHWPWPEEYLKYANGIVPYALLRYGEQVDDQDCIKLGLETLHFVDRSCRLNHHLGPVGNQGWFSGRSSHPPVYSQQPIDAAYMVWAMLSAFHATGQPSWLENASEWLDWFDGANVTGQKIYDPATDKCFDGVDDPARVSTNSGAESNICYLLSKYAFAHKQLF